jgi:hypothetical protein
MKTTLAIAFTVALGGLAHAQGFGRGDMMRDRIQWSRSLDAAMKGGGEFLSEFEKRRLKAMGIEPQDKKFIFVYIRPTSEDTEPREFNTCQDAVDAYRGAWVFVKLDFDKESAVQKAWKVTSAPACIGCDLYGNDFVKLGAPAVDTIRSVIRGTPQAVAAYEAKLKADYQKASDLVKAEDDRGSKMLVDICLSGKNGYKEVTESQAKLNELTETAFKKGDLAAAVSPDTGVEYFEDLVKIYRTTPPGARAEVLLATLDHARGNIQPAIQRLLKVMKSDPRALKAEIESAGKALDEISKAGDAKIELALNGPDKVLAKDAVRKIAKDYLGTDAGKHAADASK